MEKVVAIDTRRKEKKVSLSKRSVLNVTSNILTFVFLLSSLLTPTDNFQIKKLSFLLLMVINVFTFLAIRYTLKNRYILFFGFTYVIFLIVMSIFVRRGAVIDVLLRGYSGFMLLLFFIVQKQNINYEKMLLICIGILAIIIAVSVLLDFLNILIIWNNPLLKFLLKTDNVMLGRGGNVSFYYLIFLKSSPLILILLLYALYKRKLLIALIAFVGVFFSGTRANALVAVGALVLYILLCEKSKPVKYVAILGVLLVLVFFGKDIYEYLVKVFERKASSDAVRSGHMESLMELFRTKPTALIWGTGFNSPIFSKGADKIVTILELSYWDFLRQVGLIGFIPFMFFLLYPMFALLDTNYRWLSIAYLGFLIISYTNPFLYGSTGYCIYVYMYIVCFNKAKPINFELDQRLRLKKL